MTRAWRAAGGIVVAGVLAQAEARAQSFVERVDDDACRQAATYDVDDESAPAMRARRACHLQRFEQRLAAERQQRVAAGERKRVEAVQAWLEAHEPTRVLRPIAVGLFLGSGLASYGIEGSWTVMRRVTVDGWFGGHNTTFSDYVSSSGNASYTRKCLGVGARWFFTDLDFSPYLGVGFATTSADLQANFYDMTNGNLSALTGSASAHVLSGSVGLEFAWQGLRASLEYAYAYAFYTQANKDDMIKTPDDQLRRIWQDSLDSDRSGIRFLVGYAF
jgi:hypothetical protein